MPQKGIPTNYVVYLSNKFISYFLIYVNNLMNVITPIKKPKHFSFGF